MTVLSVLSGSGPLIEFLLAPVLPVPLFWPLLVVWGLCLGSFTTCVIYRMPRGISLWRRDDGSQRSFCPSCGHVLGVADLLPVVSWLWQKGRCRHCAAPIGAVYPAIELAVACCVLMLGFMFPCAVLVFILSFLVPFMFGLAAILLFRPRR